MNVVLDPDRIALIDPSDFTTPYNLALAGAIEAQGRWVRLVGPVGSPLHRQGVQLGHFYPLLATSWGRRLPRAMVRLIKGACEGVDMLRLFGLLKSVEATIAHFQWSPLPAFDCWFIRTLRRSVPVVLTWHDSLPGNGSEAWLMRQGYSSLLRSFDAIIVHTQQAQQRATALGIDSAVIHRIPHGLLGAGHQLPYVRRRPRRDRLVLLQFGKIKPYKGIDLLLEALTFLPQNLRNCLDVRIVGKPYMDTAGLERYVQANDLAGCVRFRFEFVSEAEEEQLFADADAVILPYRQIDASGVMMTAIARGLPVLATGIEGFRELFQGEGGGALLVPPGDAAALSKVIGEWVSAPEQLNVLAEAMLARRDSIPGWDKIALLHLAVYTEAHSRWRAGGKHGRGFSLGRSSR